MKKSVISNYVIRSLLSIFILLAASTLYAQKSFISDKRAAGFKFSAEATSPIFHYQRDIRMLSNYDDRPYLSVYGNGRVQVHYPVYMKNAGDYEMQLDDAELAALLRSLSDNGLMAYDENKMKVKMQALKKAVDSNGEKHAISDGVITTMDLAFDEYQKNISSKKIQNFKKRIRWKNIRHDARRFKSDVDITRINNTVLDINALMKDQRLVRKARK